MPSLRPEELEEKERLKKERTKNAIKMNIWFASLPPINTNDVEQIAKRISLYFETCAEQGFMIGLEGLCNALHISSQTFKSWEDGTGRKGKQLQHICQQARQMLVSYAEHGLLSGDIQPVPAIFLMTNQHGYVQKQVVQQEQSQSVLDTATPEQLDARYGADSIIDAVFTDCHDVPSKEKTKKQN